MFVEPERSPYDLTWTMFGTPIRVTPWFWVVSALLGWNAIELGIEYVLLWVACVFVSILVHEFGHVFTGRLFHAQGHIVLHGFGGLAIGSSALPNRWQRILVYLAGPVAGFLLFGVVWLVATLVLPPPRHLFVEEAVWNLTWINVAWGIVNLFPIYPLDGGQISRDLCGWLLPGKGLTASLVLSIAAGVLVMLFFLWLRYWYGALLFGILAFNSFQMLQETQSVQQYDDPYYRHRPWDRDDW
ncbi:MAG: hypothetical protein KatS3mg105_2278 [Gemmatales bacterium]|nr:MAG: hypothetical protein KatS3mg105_2278 [Gemmatales bacterium]